MDEKKQIKELIEKNKQSIIKLGRELFDCPELGFKEVKSNEILTSFLYKNGIPFETGISVTGIKATIGSGGYHIALVADMDALEIRDGEKTVPYHSCGHSIQTAVMAYVLKMLKDSGITEKFEGRVSFIAAPAEEFLDFESRKHLLNDGKIRCFSGKQDMITKGVFDDVDCVLSMHVNGESDTMFDVNSTLAGFLVKRVVFLGKAAHSGAAPHQGRNALHGASLFLNAVSYMTEQFSKEAGIQIHPVIQNCSGGVNIIPEEVVVDSYVRANTLEELIEAGKKFDACAVHCAKALGLDCRIENKTGYMPLKQSERLNTVVYKHMKEIASEEKILKNIVSGASGDVGDVGYLLPTVQFGFSGIKGRIHSSDFSIINEENVYLHTAQIVLNTVFDLLEHKELQVKNEDYESRKEFYLKNWLKEEKEL